MQRLIKRIMSLSLAVAMVFGIRVTAEPVSYDFVIVDAAVDYYAPITATSGDALLGQVHDLITSTHKKYTSYEDCKNPTYVRQTDPGTDGSSIMEFYAQKNLSSSWQQGAVGTWNREHVWCQSLSNGLWGESGGGSDLHHIRPTESRVNSSRGNNKYGIVSSKTPVYYKNASNVQIGLAGYNSGGVFEPLDQVKGDVARIVMYVYTHYNTYSNVHGTTNGSGGRFGTLRFNDIMAPSGEDASIALLLEWNESDPVDSIEMTRNDAVYSIQGNRNPFIDHPEYADAIWGEGTETLESISITPATVTLSAGMTAKLTATPHPSNAPLSVNWSTSNEAVATVSASGVVTAVSEGSATITATCKTDASIKATAQVTVVPKGEIPPDDTNVNVFRAAVDSIVTDGDIGDRLASINAAISAYQALSDDEKNRVEEEIQALHAAIADYNQTINSYNVDAQKANNAALKGTGSFIDWIKAFIENILTDRWAN